MLNKRKVQAIRHGKWKFIHFKRLKQGDRFRLYEKNGDLVQDEYGRSDFYALSDVYKDNDKWCILV